MTSFVHNAVQPIWSHGGQTDRNWPKVAGNANGAGNPIYLGSHGALGVVWPVMFLLAFSAEGGPQGSVNFKVFIEGNPGPMTGGVPDPNAWIDETNGGITMSDATCYSKLLNPAIPFYRTRIANYVSGFLDSRVGPLQLASGLLAMPTHPFKPAGGPPTFDSGF